MDNEQAIGCLAGMAEIMAERWEEELEETRDTQYAQAFAQICTAIAALNAPKPFIQIGRDIIRRDDIIRVEINEPKKIRIYTRDLVGSEIYSSQNTCHVYKYHSLEGQALLEWLQGQSEVIVSYEDPVHIQPDYEDSVNREFQRDEEAYLAEKESQAASMLAESQDPNEEGHPF